MSKRACETFKLQEQNYFDRNFFCSMGLPPLVILLDNLAQKLN